MEKESVSQNIVTVEKNPQNRKEVVIMLLKAIKEATASNDIDRQINANIDFIIGALPEIEDGKYTTDIFSLEPNFDKEKDIYTSQIDMICPEVIAAHIPRIERRMKEKYLRALQKERMIIEALLKEHTEWYFDKKGVAYSM